MRPAGDGAGLSALTSLPGGADLGDLPGLARADRD
jgi:hypothetical protein